MTDELSTYYILDDRLSLRAKGLLSIILNATYEQTVALARTSDEFAQALHELRGAGYVGRFDAECFEVRPVLRPEARYGG